MKRWTKWAAMALISMAMAGPAVAQDAGALERWKSMSPEEQEVMRERFESFQSLPPEARDVLRDRLERFRDRLGELERKLGDDETRKLDRLGPGHRGEALRDLLRERLRMRGQALRGELPPELRQGFDRAEPGRRPLWLEHNQDRVREHFHGRFEGLRGKGGGDGSHRGSHRGGFGRGGEGFGEKPSGPLREQLREQIHDRLRDRIEGADPSPRRGAPGKRFEFLEPGEARELLEAGRPRLDEILQRRESGRMERPDPRGRILDAARRSGKFSPDELGQLEEASLFELMLQLHECSHDRPQPMGV